MRLRSILFIAVLASCGCATAETLRPASEAERQEAGIDDPDIPLLIRELPAGGTASVSRESTTGSPALYQTRFGSVFSGRTSNYQYQSFGSHTSYCTSGSSERFADASLNLPSGSMITFIDVFGLDSSSSADLTAFLFEICQGPSTGAPVMTNLGQVSSSGSSGNFRTTINLAASPVAVESYSCKYIIRASMAPASAGGCVGGDILLDKARVLYTLP